MLEDCNCPLGRRHVLCRAAPAMNSQQCHKLKERHHLWADAASCSLHCAKYSRAKAAFNACATTDRYSTHKQHSSECYAGLHSTGAAQPAWHQRLAVTATGRALQQAKTPFQDLATCCCFDRLCIMIVLAAKILAGSTQPPLQQLPWWLSAAHIRSLSTSQPRLSPPHSQNMLLGQVSDAQWQASAVCRDSHSSNSST